MQKDRLEKLAEDIDKGRLKFYEDDSEMNFTCVQCGQCCHNREDILLSPFDLYNLVRATGKTVQEIIAKYGDCYVGSSSHLPLVRLRYREEPDGSTTCYFLGRKDNKFFCRVQEYKPCVCRIYPFGKVSSFADHRGNSEDKITPRYFLQTLTGNGCPGERHAREHNVTHTLLEWVGGAEKKNYSDRYTELFNAFAQKFSKVLNVKAIDKWFSDEARGAFYGIIGNLMYVDYTFSVGESEFLNQMERNFSVIVGITEKVCINPEEFMKLVKESMGKKGKRASGEFTA